jgi:hypothetical protein
VATVHTTWYGVVVEFSHAETTQLTTACSTGAASVGFLAAILAAIGITGPAAVISGIVTAIITLGGAALGACNSKSKGIKLHVLWVGLP